MTLVRRIICRCSFRLFLGENFRGSNCIICARWAATIKAHTIKHGWFVVSFSDVDILQDPNVFDSFISILRVPTCSHPHGGMICFSSFDGIIESNNLSRFFFMQISTTQLVIVLVSIGIVWGIYIYLIASGILDTLFRDLRIRRPAATDNDDDEMEPTLRLTSIYDEIYGPIETQANSEETRNWLWLLIVFLMNVFVIRIEMEWFAEDANLSGFP
jgi:hypothetical protein